MAHVWELTAAQYQAQQGVKQPHIAEIAPSEYASLSRRGKARYDAKREQEWDASAACKQEWRDKVIAAHDADEFNRHDTSVSNEARAVIAHEVRRRAEEVAKYRLREASKQNVIMSPEQIKPGDRVFSIMSRSYMIVDKVSAKSLRARFENPPAWATGQTFKQNYGAIYWLSPNDLAATV